MNPYRNSEPKRSYKKPPKELRRRAWKLFWWRFFCWHDYRVQCIPHGLDWFVNGTCRKCHKYVIMRS